MSDSPETLVERQERHNAPSDLVEADYSERTKAAATELFNWYPGGDVKWLRAAQRGLEAADAAAVPKPTSVFDRVLCNRPHYRGVKCMNEPTCCWGD